MVPRTVRVVRALKCLGEYRIGSSSQQSVPFVLRVVRNRDSEQTGELSTVQRLSGGPVPNSVGLVLKLPHYGVCSDQVQHMLLIVDLCASTTHAS